jgi:protein involved in polysaccharide export with SLBB domain
VDSVQARVRVRYDDLNTYLASQPGEVRVSPMDGGRRVEVTSNVDVPLLGTQQVGGITTFQVKNNQLTLVPSEITLRGALNLSIPLGGLGQLIPTIALPVGELPFRLTVNDASTDASGLSLTATAKDVVLPKQSAPVPCQPAQG